VKKHLVKQNKWTAVGNLSVSHSKVPWQGTDRNDPHKALGGGLLGLNIEQSVVVGRFFLVKRV